MKPPAQAVEGWTDKTGLCQRIIDGTASDADRAKLFALFPSLRAASLDDLVELLAK